MALTAEVTLTKKATPTVSTVGVAMIARNGADLMPRALGPLLPHVDQVSICLGGYSDDNTEELAHQLAHVVTNYTGPLDEDGRLLDFSAARNQSIRHLGTDWVLVVDCDDICHGAENLREVIADAEKAGASSVMFPYGLPNSEMRQGRLFKRSSGEYVGPIHEIWKYNDPTLTTAASFKTRFEHQPGQDRDERLAQNIALLELHLKANPRDGRSLLHLAQDYGQMGDYETSLAYGQIFLDTRKKDEHDKDFYEFRVLHMMGMAALQLERWETAKDHAILALRVFPPAQGQAWAILAEAFCQIGVSDRRADSPMFQLSVEAADKALRYGLAGMPFPSNAEHVQASPYHIKARAYYHSLYFQEAKAAAKIALRLTPDNTAITRLLDDILSGKPHHSRALSRLYDLLNRVGLGDAVPIAIEAVAGGEIDKPRPTDEVARVEYAIYDTLSEAFKDAITRHDDIMLDTSLTPQEKTKRLDALKKKVSRRNGRG